MKDYKLYLQRIGLIGITNLLVALSSIFLLPIITKNFSIEDYGVFVQIITAMSLIPNITLLGLPFSMLRFISILNDKRKIREEFYSIFFVVLACSIIISLMIYILSTPIATALFGGDAEVTKLLSIILLFTALNLLLLNYFRTFNQMKRYSIFLLAQTYIGFFLVTYFVITGYGIFYIVLSYLISNLILFLIMICIILSEIGFKIPKFKYIKKYLSFGLPTVPGNISYWVVDSMDRFIIGILLGTAFVGFYSPGYTIGNIILMLIAPFTLILPSILPKYYENNDMRTVNMYINSSLKIFLLIAIPCAFTLSLLSKPILTLLTTPEIALNGYLITPFIAVSAILFGCYGIIGNILILAKKTKIFGILWIIAAILNIILNIVTIPNFGILGAAIATLCSYSLVFLVSTFYSTKYFELKLEMSYIIKSIISSSLISIIIILANPQGIQNILIIIIICAMLYFVLLMIFKSFKKKEIKLMKDMFYSK
ncbi:oligosaccharide flippase family protein [Methanobacterium sp.]|uniref:oligosaccharide flippase family protein n=1 Tax=Methanobacterium sp. TaxID=2164 RepID=UPI002AB95C8D|nr:oligosaccharide flippase family protein [Methanobacterium sp.]MDY9922948.1 oligosaccharide flippase family protein [Methanobacterium sp.]